MKISTRGRYALRFMADLAEHEATGFVPLKDISERQDISIKYLEQITARLTKSGLLISTRGPQGGYKLARPQNQYTVGEILRITEGNLAPVSCLEANATGCGRQSICATIKLWKGLGKVINAYLDGITLDQLTVLPETLDYSI